MSYRPSEPLGGEGRYSIGLHPCYAEDMSQEAWHCLRERVTSEGDAVWAIGEAGLDKLSPVALPEQEHYLRLQIALSEELGKPLVLHCVRAFAELLALRKELRPRQLWVIHGYRKGAGLARQLLDAGFALSFGRYYDAEALRLAYDAGALYLETDDADISIEEVYERVAYNLGLELTPTN